VSGSVQAIFDQHLDPVPVATTRELDELLDRIQAAAPADAPPLVALDMPDRQRSLVIGLRGPVGLLNFVDLNDADGGAVSKADSDGAETPPYFYCGHWTEFPTDAELPIDDVRAAAREYLSTGHRPTNVTWQ
jgi:hypothetical protein